MNNSSTTDNCDFVRVSLEERSNITYTLSLANKMMNRERSSVLKVSFYGKYRDGSSGAADAWYMSAIIKASLDVWHPNGLILDLSELIYEWGDNIEMIFSPSDLSEIPFSAVLGARCEKAIGTLINGENSQHSIYDTEYFFASTNDAIQYMCTKFDEINERNIQYTEKYSSKKWGISKLIWKHLKQFR